MVEAQATARGIRTSAQKAGLVCDLIRGKSVNQALATLQFTRKMIAREIAKVLRSAVANLQQKDGFGGDIERLYVSACYANQGMSMKRGGPAPMGRAYRVVKRTAHLTVHIAERPLKIAKGGTEGGASTPARGRETARGAQQGAGAAAESAGERERARGVWGEKAGRGGRSRRRSRRTSVGGRGPGARGKKRKKPGAK